MPKQVETVEKTIEKIDATNCPEREHHRQRVGLVCVACAELIPPGGAYTPEQFERYFGSPVVQPPSPWGLTDEEKELWVEYDRVRLEHEASLFKVFDLERGVPPRVVSIDYATGLQADFGGGALADVRVNPLVEPRARSDPAAFTQVIDNLSGRLTDASIADAIARVPRQLLPSDDERARLKQGIEGRRNVLPALLRQRYP
jgi:hypothetical protein